jgi:predicted MFS family arabinose efflux permease
VKVPEEKASQVMPLNATEEWKRGWQLVLACFVGFSFFSIMTHSLGVFMEPLSSEFGWSRTLISSGVTIASVMTALLSPFFGILIDRYGSRAVAMPGLVACAVAISCFALANGSPLQWMLLWLFYAVISISVKTTVWTAAVVGSFTTAQGLALGFMLSGTAAAQIILPPLATWLLQEFGWRMAYVWLGLGWGGLTFLLCYFFLHDLHRKRPVTAAAGEGQSRARPGLPGLSIAEARRDLALWRIAISTLIMMLLTIGLLIHQIPILMEAGLSAIDAAWLASLAGVAGIVGKLVSGVLLDRFRANWVGGLTLASTAFAFALLIDGVHTPALVVVAMVINGYSAGSKLQIASYLTARYSGTRHFGVIYGVMTSLVAFGSGVGPMAAGFVYDLTGSYTVFLIVGTAGSLFCGLLILTLPRYPDWNERAQAGVRPA